jgi:anti-sigma-K factor RskA
MSDQPLDLTPADDIDLLAAEFVLGLLDSDAHRAAARRLDSDPGFAVAVEAWERRLTALALQIEPVTPGVDVWPAIARRLPTFATDRWSWWDSLPLWRAATAMAGVAAAVLAFVALQPEPLPPAPERSQAILASTPMRTEGGRVLFVVTLDEASKRVVVTPVGADGQPGHSHELWLLPEGGQPVSLGLMPTANAASMTVSVPITAQASLAISVEPEGGSPTGLPTGPVVAQGRLSPL